MCLVSGVFQGSRGVTYVRVINGNLKSKSFCHELADSFIASSEQNNDVRVISLSDLRFEPDLIDFQQSLLWSEHVVFILPVWWGGMPAKFKGLIDRTFLPGFAFKFKENKSIPEKLLEGRTADVILTMDTPPFYYRWFQGNPVYKQLKRTILEFCGFKQISATYVGPLMNSTQEQRDKWRRNISKLAAKV